MTRYQTARSAASCSARAQQPPGPPELLGGVRVGHREGLADGDHPKGGGERAGLGRFEQRPPALGAAREERADRVLLGAEVAVEGAQGDAGVPGDGLGGGAVGPVLREERGRGAGDVELGRGLAALGQGGPGRLGGLGSDGWAGCVAGWITEQAYARTP